MTRRVSLPDVNILVAFVTLDRSVGAGLPGSSPLLRHIAVIEV